MFAPLNYTNPADLEDYDIPHDTGMPAILAGILIPHIMCTLVILGRVISRLFFLGRWYIDDTLIVTSWAFSTAICIIYSIAAYTPDILLAPNELTLQHNLEVEGRAGSIHPYIMRTYLGLIFYQLCLCLTKLSVLAFYLRMFTENKKERWIAWGTMCFVFLYGIPMLFISIFQCHPQDGQFFGRPMTCFGFAPLIISSAGLHTATDAWIIILAIPCISRLDVPPRQKVALSIVLSLSIFVIAASLLRLQLSLHRHFRPGSVGVTNTLAFFVMTILECDVALICASAPMLRPVLAKLWPKMMMMDQRRRRVAMTRDDTDDGSVDLAFAGSYHGYPWRNFDGPVPKNEREVAMGHVYEGWRSTTPGSTLSDLERATERGTTPLSLRSFFGSTRRLPQQFHRYNEDDGRAMLRSDVAAESRPVSIGFEDYFLSHQQPLPPTPQQRTNSKQQKKSKEYEVSEARWDQSQESFVLGVDDPRYSRLSPVSGFSGETCAAPGEGEGEEAGLTTATPTTGEERVPQELVEWSMEGKEKL
ncbi:Integral membrane protein [Scedosporium apiospermum]|uniref:Integral membrane protein n=1 Tax=Pseudallescheria apiosperma TaxID=563466 RepID=A0A084G4D2_PSEDA|nr:Integral membrane protein [Scedosporium apiospermum]KEZ42194.1 Integral membrane protein [Scedosporium apiospermum]